MTPQLPTEIAEAIERLPHTRGALRRGSIDNAAKQRLLNLLIADTEPNADADADEGVESA